jgi:hypothetical protein
VEFFVGLFVMIVVGVPLLWFLAFIGFQIDKRFLANDVQHMAETRSGRFAWAAVIGIMATGMLVGFVTFFILVATSIGGIFVG